MARCNFPKLSTIRNFVFALSLASLSALHAEETSSTVGKVHTEILNTFEELNDEELQTNESKEFLAALADFNEIHKNADVSKINIPKLESELQNLQDKATPVVAAVIHEMIATVKWLN